MESLALAIRMEAYHHQYVAMHKRIHHETIVVPRSTFARNLHGFMRWIALNGGVL